MSWLPTSQSEPGESREARVCAVVSFCKGKRVDSQPRHGYIGLWCFALCR